MSIPGQLCTHSDAARRSQPCHVDSIQVGVNYERMVTLADVARAAGVSLATASRVFSKPEKVASSTRERVQTAATHLGYVGNSTARALATGTSGLVGLIVPDLGSPYFTPLIAAIQTEIARSGYELIIADSTGAPETELTIARRLRGRADGLILASPRASDSDLLEVGSELPLITVNHVAPGISSVGVDVTIGLTKLCELLVARGHRRITYVGGPPGSRTDDGRFAVISSAMASQSGTVTRLGPVTPRAGSGADCYPAIRQSHATAVIAYNALVAHGLILAATADDVAIPDQLAVAAADDLIDVGLGLPTITAITQPLTHVGEKAGELVIAEIAAGDRHEPHRIAFPGVLTLGATV